MTISDLLTAILNYVAAADRSRRPSSPSSPSCSSSSPSSCRVVVLPKKLGPLGPRWIHVAAHYKHAQGRNKATETLTAALAEKGDAEQLIRGLREVRQISPMDAPRQEVAS